jgi:hypothetical protein
MRRVSALRRRDPATGELLLPGKEVHELQEGLFAGPATAAARLELLHRRYAGDGRRAAALATLGAHPEPGPRRITGLLDARHAADFLTATEADA